MIKTKTLIIGDRNFVKTYSDSGYLIERNGVKYSEAVDPEGSGRVYTETSERVPEEELTAEEALAIIAGGAHQ